MFPFKVWFVFFFFLIILKLFSLREKQFVEITKKRLYLCIHSLLSCHSFPFLAFLQQFWDLGGCLCLYLFHVANSQNKDCRSGYWDRTPPILLVAQMQQDMSLKNESCPREMSQRTGKALWINVVHQAGNLILKMPSFLRMKT